MERKFITAVDMKGKFGNFFYKDFGKKNIPLGYLHLTIIATKN